MTIRLTAPRRHTLAAVIVAAVAAGAAGALTTSTAVSQPAASPPAVPRGTVAGLPDAALRDANRQLVRKYLTLLEEMKVEEWADLWAEDGVQQMPYAPAGFPTRFEGKKELLRHFRKLRTAFASMRFPVTALTTLEDPEWVLAEYRGEIAVKAGGRYDNRYCVLFHIRGGKVLLAREYFNPAVLTGSKHYGGLSK